jgi:hypothetical protein
MIVHRRQFHKIKTLLGYTHSTSHYYNLDAGQIISYTVSSRKQAPLFSTVDMAKMGEGLIL